MKRVLILLLVMLSVTPAILAGEKNKKKKNAKETGIKWMTWDQAQVQMKKQPKKVWVDVYTDWCGWCKVMDKKNVQRPAGDQIHE
jgi:thiol:disulfide interchange protein